MITSEQFEHLRKIFSGSTTTSLPTPAPGGNACRPRRSRITAFRLRAKAWMMVRLFGAEFIRGAGNQAGRIICLLVAGYLVFHLTGLNLQDVLAL
ncbi:hypothetical protein [Streptomyces sp. PA03-2a]|uniref:hypothetical protein n=1 Tax=Streptomyces sp. PA03-2a TaxID=3028701 RepID=UPI0029BB7D4E|nr:hypothetical protein [Streptomyces sp. PA03-2a]MDX2733606.1 hypothetical protein [Streptomyces sp. PA03-2a]